MNAKDIYSKTMPFNMAKLLLGLAMVGISVILLAILMGMGWLFGDGGMLVAFVIWLGATGVVRFIIMHYLGYLVKAGHVAVISMAVTTGRVPANQVAVGKQMVKDRFVESNVYFIVDKLVAGAVKQLQNVLERTGNKLDFIPGMDAAVGVGKLFIGISLGYIDECCLGYTFYKKEQGPFRSAADGVVIYAQNWKKLLKDAAKTTGMVLALMAAIIIVVFVVLGIIFKLLHWSPLAAFILACLVAWTIKFAFVDSWILVKMMASYMEEAHRTQITFDLYQKLSGVSGKFKELLEKGRQEPRQQWQGQGGGLAQAAGQGQGGGFAQAAEQGQGGGFAQAAEQDPGRIVRQPEAGRPGGTGGSESGAAAGIGVGAGIGTGAGGDQRAVMFCGQCGAKNEQGAKFCGSCGSPM